MSKSSTTSSSSSAEETSTVFGFSLTFVSVFGLSFSDVDVLGTAVGSAIDAVDFDDTAAGFALNSDDTAVSSAVGEVTVFEEVAAFESTRRAFRREVAD